MLFSMARSHWLYPCSHYTEKLIVAATEASTTRTLDTGLAFCENFYWLAGLRHLKVVRNSCPRACSGSTAGVHLRMRD